MGHYVLIRLQDDLHRLCHALQALGGRGVQLQPVGSDQGPGGKDVFEQHQPLLLLLQCGRLLQDPISFVSIPLYIWIVSIPVIYGALNRHSPTTVDPFQPAAPSPPGRQPPTPGRLSLAPRESSACAGTGTGALIHAERCTLHSSIAAPCAPSCAPPPCTQQV